MLVLGIDLADISIYPDLDGSLIAGFITLYIVQWIILHTRNKYDLILVLYLIIILVYIPLLIWGQNPDLYKGFGILLGLTVSTYLNSTMIERTFHLSLEHRALFIITTIVIMIVLFYIFDILFTILSDEATMVRNLFDFIRYFGIILYALHQYPKHFFMILNRSR